MPATKRPLQRLFSPPIMTVIPLIVFVLMTWVIPIPKETEAPGTYAAYGLLFIFSVFLLGLLITVAVHETGHVLGGLMVGYRFAAYSPGPFRIYSLEHHVRFKLNWTWARVGATVMVPKVGQQPAPWREMVYFLGGPMANLLFGAFAAILFLNLGDTGSLGEWRYSLYTLIYPLRGVSAMVGVLNLIPMKGTSDGAQLLVLLKRGPTARRMTAIRVINSLLVTGYQRPREWDTVYIEHMTALPDGSDSDCIGNYIGYLWAVDRGLIDQAGIFINRALAARHKAAPFRQIGILLEGAYYEARYSRNPELAKVWLSMAQADKKGTADPSNWRRVEAAILWADGKYQEAAQRAQESLKALAQQQELDTMAGQLEAGWVNDLLLNAQQHLERQAVPPPEDGQLSIVPAS